MDYIFGACLVVGTQPLLLLVTSPHLLCLIPLSPLLLTVFGLYFGLERPSQNPPHLCRHFFLPMMCCWIPLGSVHSWNSWQIFTRPLLQPVSQQLLHPQSLLSRQLLRRHSRQPRSAPLTLTLEPLVRCPPIDPGGTGQLGLSTMTTLNSRYLEVFSV